MITKKLSLIIISSALLFLLPGSLLAQEENVIIENYNLDLAKVSPPHRMLSKLAGKWNLNYKLWKIN